MLLLVCPSLWAGQQPSGNDETVAVPQSSAEEQTSGPDIGFLEFLGQWETDDGHWMAPEELADDTIAALIADMVPTDEDDSE